MPMERPHPRATRPGLVTRLAALLVGSGLLAGLWTACQGPDMMAPRGDLARVATEPRAPAAGDQDLSKQTQADADRKSGGCVTCHTKTDSPSMHTATTVKLGCVDCLGGQVDVRLPDGVAPGSARY